MEGEAMTKPAADSKQAIPCPEDRVRAIREKLENVKSGRWHKTLWTESAPEDVAYLLSLVEELIPFCDSPCGHTSQYAYSEDGGKNIVCLICEREELKGQVVSASQQPRCPEHKIEMVQKVDRKVSFWGCPNDGCGLFISVELLNQVAQFFPAAPTELSLLTKRKDYHAEYVEAVEAVEKAQGALRSILAESGIDWIMGGKIRDIAERALTPEPASQSAEEKK